MPLTIKHVEKLNYVYHKNAIILSQGKKTGVYIDGEYIKYSGADVRGRENEKNWRLSDIYSEEIKTYDETVIFLGHMVEHYGVFLVDSLSRFWFLLQEKYENTRYAISIPCDESKLPLHVKEVLRGVGINKGNTIFLHDCAAKFSEIIVPELSYAYNEYISYLYSNTFRWIGDRLQNKEYYDQGRAKIYLSREDFKDGIAKNNNRPSRFEYGGYSIEQIFRDNGYMIIYPEKMTLSQQVSIYRKADVIVTQNGSLAHNILWTNGNTRMVCLQRYEIINMHQEYINSVMENSFESIDCYAKGGFRHLNCMIISKELRDFFKRESFQIKYTPRMIMDMLASICIFEIRKIRWRYRDIIKNIRHK